MTKPARKPARVEPAPPLAERGVGALSAALLAGVCGLLVCRLIVPTEGAVLGDSVLIVQGWLGAVLVWVWHCRHTGGLRLRIDRLDAAVWLLVGGQVVSALIVIGTAGDARAAWNMLWEWVALGLTFFLVRQLFDAPLERRHLVAAFVALAIAMSGYGVWQRYVWYPQVAAEYMAVRSRLDELERSPLPVDSREAWQRQEQMTDLRRQLLRQGVAEHMLQGSGRDLFESRLRDSVEPFGRFALANTFAGFLLVGLLILTAGLVEDWRRRERAKLPWLAGLTCAAALVAFCLLLTKSRTAYVGLAAGLTAWAVSQLRRGFAPSKKLVVWLAGSVAAVVVLVGIAAATGGLDRFVLAEAPKSLRYRLEYWRGSWGVIREQPWFGVGPGNFRQHYLRHKLPESSEEIADPHNMLLDVWANGGLLALAGLLGIGAAAVALVWMRRRERESRGSLVAKARAASLPVEGKVAGGGGHVTPVQSIGNFQQAASHVRRRNESDAPLRTAFRSPVLWGSGLGFLAVYGSTWALDQSLLGLAAGWLAALGLCLKCEALERLPGHVWGAAAVGLLVHLLGAGGIGMPAIVQTLFVAVALGTLAEGLPRREIRVTVRGGTAMATGIGLLLFLACFQTTTQPVLLRKALLAQAEDAVTPAQREAGYRRAAAADPNSSEPWEALASLAFQKWTGTRPPDDDLFAQAVALQEQAIERDPFSFTGYRMLGLMYQARFQLTRQAGDARKEAEWLVRAAERYPQHATMQAELAEAWDAAGERTAAQQAAQRALELDRLNHQAGHRDKYLTEAQHARLTALVGSSKGPEEKREK